MADLSAVLFDIDDTLFSTTVFASKARHAAVQAMVHMGLKATEEEVFRELQEVLREFGSNYAHHYQKLLMRLPRAVLGDLNPALVESAGVVAYHDTKFGGLEPFPDVLPLLSKLKEAGIQTGIITHGWTIKQAEKLIRLGVLPLVDPKAVFISDQVGISKPNPKLYSLALRKLGLEAEQVMYVGDSLEHDVAPPGSLGIRTVWSRRAAKDGQDPEAIRPDHIIDDFGELEAILRDSYSALPTT
jgi:putative hydrolase of the HAD superfamily